MSRTIAVLLVLALGAPVLLADATIKKVTRTTAPGGMGDIRTEETTKYEGPKQAVDSDVDFVGGMLGAFAQGGGRSTKVTRVDLRLIWHFNPETMTYTELPLQLPDVEEMGGYADSMQVEVESRGSYEIVNSEVSVTGPGEEKDINNFPCSQYVLTYLVEMVDTEAGTEASQTMVVDLWATPMTEELKKVQAAELEYTKKLFEAWDAEMSPEQMQNLGLGMLTASYGVDQAEAEEKLAEVAEELGKIEGYAIVTQVDWDVQTDVGMEEEPEPETESSGGPGFPTSLGGLKGLVGGVIAEEVEKSMPEPETGVKFSSYIEVKSVSAEDVPSSDFEKKEGYTKVEVKLQQD